MTSHDEGPAPGPFHAFVDESKRKGFSLVRCDLPASRVNDVRAELRALLRGGQHRIHFYRESDAVRTDLLSILMNSDVSIAIAHSTLPQESMARAACMAALAIDAQERDVSILTIELDETQRNRDDRVLHEAVTFRRGTVAWRHMKASSDPGLWLPDAVGWCLHHPTARWRKAIAPLDIRFIDVGGA